HTYYFYFFILASLILLVAMLGAIVLTLHKGVHIRRQDVFEQNTREFAKTVIKVS
ncbi:MAG TPA: NADH-quinone oxidoreductase subunit J, partial [Methylophilaceae bacterium]|nr:NADH-quinone oxidoreductase subunit J [Methylophilaceae bacterium]